MDWDFNEILLVVDCYKRISKQTDKPESVPYEAFRDSEIEKLSELLRRRIKQWKKTIDHSCRDFYNVKQKLDNIAYLATYGKSGWPGYSAIDKRAYNLSNTDPCLFAELVEAVRDVYSNRNQSSIPEISAKAKPRLTPVPVESEKPSMPAIPTKAKSRSTPVPDESEKRAMERMPLYKRYHLRPEDYANMSIDDVGFSARLIKGLRQEGISNFSDILLMSASQVLLLKNCGRSCLKEIESFISGFVSVPAVGKMNSDMIAPPLQVLIKHKEAFLLGDFSFSDSVELSAEDKKQIEKIRKAYEIVGSELFNDCVTKSSYINNIIEVFADFHKECLKKARASALLALFPVERSELPIGPFIRAFSDNPTTRASLCSLCPNQNASIKEVINSVPITNEEENALLQQFISWCAFDICKEVNSLFNKIFPDTRAKSILEMRADNKTLDEIGKAFSITRECVRQIEKKLLISFARWEKKNRLLLKVFALLRGKTLIFSTELEKLFGNDTRIIVYLLKKTNDPAAIYLYQIDAFFVGEPGTQYNDSP